MPFPDLSEGLQDVPTPTAAKPSEAPKDIGVTPTIGTESMIHELDLVPFSPFGPPSSMTDIPQTSKEASEDQSRLPLLPLPPIAVSAPSISALAQPNSNPSASSQQQPIKIPNPGMASNKKAVLIDNVSDKSLESLRQSKKMQKDGLLKAFGERPVIYMAKKKGIPANWKHIEDTIIPILETRTKCQISVEPYNPNLKDIKFARKLVFKQESGAEFTNADTLNAKINEVEKAYLVYMRQLRRGYHRSKGFTIPATINVPDNISPTNSTNSHHSHSFSSSTESNTNASLSNSSNSNSNFTPLQQVGIDPPLFVTTGPSTFVGSESRSITIANPQQQSIQTHNSAASEEEITAPRGKKRKGDNSNKKNKAKRQKTLPEYIQKDRLYLALNTRPVIYTAKDKGVGWKTHKLPIISQLADSADCQISVKEISNIDDMNFATELVFKDRSGAEIIDDTKLNTKINAVEKAYIALLKSHTNSIRNDRIKKAKAVTKPSVLPTASTSSHLFPSAAKSNTEVNLPDISHSNSNFASPQQVNEPQPTLSYNPSIALTTIVQNQAGADGGFSNELLKKILSQLQSDQTLATVAQTKQEVTQVLQEVAQMKRELAQAKQMMEHFRGGMAIVTSIQENHGNLLLNIERSRMLSSQQTNTSSTQNNTIQSLYTAQNPNLLFQPATGSTGPTLEQLARGFPSGG